MLNNIASATRPNVAAIVVEATTTDNDNAIGPNFLGSAVGAPLYRWGTQTTRDGASLPLDGQGPDLIGTPAFRAPASPLAGGLALTASPARAGIPLGATRDIAGRAYAPGEVPTFGAYRSP
ncbi:hypothetical protein [Methylobacterium sp. P5_C11]